MDLWSLSFYTHNLNLMRVNTSYILFSCHQIFSSSNLWPNGLNQVVKSWASLVCNRYIRMRSLSWFLPLEAQQWSSGHIVNMSTHMVTWHWPLWPGTCDHTSSHLVTNTNMTYQLISTKYSAVLTLGWVSEEVLIVCTLVTGPSGAAGTSLSVASTAI